MSYDMNFLVVGIVSFLSLGLAAVCRNATHKGAIGTLKAYQEKVDRCLLSNSDLRSVITQGMLEEWALLIRFFSYGDEPRKLCVPVVLFLWEKIFEPKMSHDEVLELNKRIKSACGLDRVFSRRNFESTASDSIRESGYDAAWRIWRQLEDYAYSISERIAGNVKLKTPPGFGASVYKLLRNWDGKFEHIMMLPVDWKLFFKEHPEFAEHELLVRYGVLSAEEQGKCAERVSETPYRPEPRAGCDSFTDESQRDVIPTSLGQLHVNSPYGETGRTTDAGNFMADERQGAVAVSRIPRLCNEIRKIKRFLAAHDEMAALEVMKKFIAFEPTNVDAKIHFALLLWKFLITEDNLSPSVEAFFKELKNEVEHLTKESGDMIGNRRLRLVWESFQVFQDFQDFQEVAKDPHFGIVSGSDIITRHVTVAVLILGIVAVIIWLIFG